ncbi:cytochrome C assembly family protein [Salinibacillus xinjiangensis]|uniref:Cytochrome C assembly protein n=1 Tax=Salinibacillus xinjiangensis TaxID=1229268 RepID=A0A6G1XBC7_9BACI|nr:cytochrome c biogenesis protein CcsA [Salinibacillus xinjiangensis]MRG88206.1 cytochrome C assembly protein [Salinibacillus xinjiangensis]
MVHFDFKWVYELIIIIYGLSIMGYFIDFIQQNQKVNRLSFWFLSTVWLLQTFFLFSRMLSDDRFPILTIYDGLYFYAWILITFSLIINRLFRVDFFVFFTNVLGFFLMVMYIFSRAQNAVDVNEIDFVSEMLITHITLAIVSYSFFTFSFIFSCMYLLQYKMLKEKKWSIRLKRLGNLNQLENFSFLSVLLGVPMLLIAVILGVIWGYTSNEPFYWYDVKTLGSFFVIIVYGILLFFRVAKGMQGKKLAYFNVYAFLFLLVNYFLFSTLSNFHF